MEAARTLCARERALEGRHFGFAALRDIARVRWRTLASEERMEMATLAHALLADVARGGVNEPYVIKSKAATLMAEVARQEGAELWARLVPDLVRMCASEGGQSAELAMNVVRFVAEDVAIHNEDMIGGRLRDLLGGLTSTLPAVLPAIYSVMEKHYVKSTSCQDAQEQKAHLAAVNAALGACAVYGEWAPLAAFMRSGLIEACGMLLMSSDFRVAACDALRNVIARKSTAAQVAEPADEADIIKGLTLAANALSATAERVTANPNQQDLLNDPEEVEFIRRLADTMSTMASYQLSTITDENVRNTFLERVLGLTRFASLEVLDVVINLWPVLLRAMGAELPKTFIRGPPSQGVNNPYNAPKIEPTGILPNGASEALLEIGKWWINAGAGIALGFDTKGIPGNKVEEWRESFENPSELRETWVQVRAKWMDIVKLCSALCPTNAANQAVQNTFTVLSWAQPGGPLANASDETTCAALEGASSFLEAVMAALPTEGPSFEGFASTLEALLNQLVNIDFKTPHSNAQVAKLLETYGKFARSRPDAARMIMSRMFTVLRDLPTDLTAGAPPVRQRDIIASGRSGQAARQKVCAAILVVCASAPTALNPLLQDFAGQIETMSVGGKLSGAERGSLAEALLAVAGPSGPMRVREVLEWLIAPVRQRWVPNGVLSPEVAHLLSPPVMAAGEAAGGMQGLSSAHWEFFHDIQLTERCLRRSLGDAEASRVPAGLIKPVDSPPSIVDCPAVDHMEWSITLVSSLLQTIHAYWTPAGRAVMHSVGLSKSLDMSPEERAAYLVHGPARARILDSEEAGVTQTVAAARDWMRCLRDCSYSVFALFSVHASAAFYPSPQIASTCGASVLAHLPHMELRHLRQCIHATVRPIIGRCPASYRNLWYSALVNPLCASLHDRLSAGWMDSSVVNAQATMDKSEDEESSGVRVDDLINERILRDVTRDHCALLAIIAAPEGTFGRRTKGSGLTGVIGDMSNTVLGTAHAGGKHILDWINQGDANAVRAGIATGTAALTWEDAESTGHAVSFVNALTAAAGSNDAPQALRETVGADVFQAALVALTQSSNASHQADILGVIRDVIIWLLPKTQSVGQILMSLPGMTRGQIDGFVNEIGQMRSEKKAANYIKDFLIKASGGGEELRALVESRSSATKTGTAVQIPKLTPRNPEKLSPDGFSAGFSAEEASRAIGI